MHQIWGFLIKKKANGRKAQASDYTDIKMCSGKSFESTSEMYVKSCFSFYQVWFWPPLMIFW